MYNIKETNYIIDTHAHYDDKAYDDDREAVLSSLKNDNIGIVVNIGVDSKTNKKSIELAKKYSFIYATLGIHPSEVKYANPSDINFIRDNLNNEKVVAIGEIGLDYHWDKEPKIRELQKRYFLMQLDIAKNACLPVVIHSRDAAKDTLDIMMSYDNSYGGIIHCYSYALDDAIQYVNRGYYLGIGGVITFNNAKKLRNVVENISIDNIVLETDSPYLSPIRGQRNVSNNLKLVIDEISRIKSISCDEIIKITNENAKKIYKRMVKNGK